MISIYQTYNSADAHLIRRLLEEERIATYMANMYLDSVENPTGTLYDVHVALKDVDRARVIIEAWEHAPLADDVETDERNGG